MMTEFPAGKVGSILSAIGPVLDLKLGTIEWQLSGSEFTLGHVSFWVVSGKSAFIPNLGLADSLLLVNAPNG
jgi:hypothetical protein